MEVDSRKLGAVIERPTADVGDTIGNRHAAQAATLSERLIVNAGNLAAKIKVDQARTLVERLTADVGGAVGNRHAGQAITIHEGIASDAGDAAAKSQVV